MLLKNTQQCRNQKKHLFEQLFSFFMAIKEWFTSEKFDENTPQTPHVYCTIVLSEECRESMFDS